MISIPPTACINHEKYQGVFNGAPPKTESIVTDITSGDTNDMISSHPSRIKLRSIGSLNPLVYLRTAAILCFFKQYFIPF